MGGLAQAAYYEKLLNRILKSTCISSAVDCSSCISTRTLKKFYEFPITTQLDRFGGPVGSLETGRAPRTTTQTESKGQVGS